MSGENFLQQTPVKKLLVMLVVPAMMAAVIAQLNMLIDTFFLGRFAYHAVVAQAAISTTMSLTFFIGAFAEMLAVGGAIKAAHLLGEKRYDLLRQSTANSFVTALMLFTVLIVVFIPILEPLIVFLNKDVATDSPAFLNAYYYAFVMISGYISIILMRMTVEFIRSEGKSKIIVMTSIIQVLINIVLNYLFLAESSPISFYGSDFEAMGAAIATVVSQFVQAGILLTILFVPNKSVYHINLKSVRLNQKWLSDVRKLGTPIFTVNVLSAIGVFLLSFSLSLVDFTQSEFITAVASYGIVIRLIIMIFLLVNGAAQGLAGFFAFSYKRGLNERIDEAIKFSFVGIFTFGLSMSVMLLLFSSKIAGIFSVDSDVVNLVAFGLRSYFLGAIFFPISHLCFVLFSTLGKPKLALISAVLRDGLLFIVFAFLLPFYFKGFGAVTVFSVSHVIGGLIIIILFLKVNRDWKIK